ncbi:hypothetical protein BLA29_011681 [Euroglyphus maynei]|uniref:Uncharacterized protein n=1 Tax=Euroglyphus maynei TaxID=6958 RepID=A0A1Y3BML9_EURMA|nr:hypothetical protein BLA29_011681 [Euroglyphus maynei]
MKKKFQIDFDDTHQWVFNVSSYHNFSLQHDVFQKYLAVIGLFVFVYLLLLASVVAVYPV